MNGALSHKTMDMHDYNTSNSLCIEELEYCVSGATYWALDSWRAQTWSWIAEGLQGAVSSRYG